jgi:hypothetical protein
MLVMLPGIAGAQTPSPSTPIASPQAPEQGIWENLDGVQQAVMRTWGDVPVGTPAPGETPTLRFVTGLIAQFDSAEHAAAGVEPIQQWMAASLQVNLVEVDLMMNDVEVTDLGDSASAVTATGTANGMPFSLAVVVVQDGDRVVASGSTVTADEDMLPISQALVTDMLEREPSGEESRDNVGRFTGGLWSIFPESGAEVLDGMRGQGDLPIYHLATPES